MESNREQIIKVLQNDISKLTKFDLDEDENVTKDEVITYLSNKGAKYPEKSATMIFQNLDLNQDGKLSYKEIKERALRINAKKIKDLLNKEVDLMLSNDDSNKDGKISFEEMVSSFVKTTFFDQKSATDTANFYFKAYDKDGNGFLTRDELLNSIAKDMGVDVPNQ